MRKPDTPWVGRSIRLLLKIMTIGRLLVFATATTSAWLLWSAAGFAQELCAVSGSSIPVPCAPGVPGPPGLAVLVSLGAAGIYLLGRRRK
jgi:hypothetical protein